MRIPIPQDWNGQDWRCVELQWPDSDEWTWLLSGLFSLYFRGRLWDEGSGSILDAVAVGRDIWERNKGFSPCGSTDCPQCPVCPACPTGSVCGAMSECDECEDDMACGKESAPIKIEGGKLYWWSRDCCDWIEIGDIAHEVQTLPPDPLNPGQEPDLEYSACGKAYALAAVLFSIGNNCWDEIDNFPWQWIPHVEQDVGIDLDNTWVINLCIQCEIMAGLAYLRSSFLNAEEEQWLRSAIYNMLADDSAGITEDQYNSLRSIFVSHQGVDIFRQNFWTYAFYALGWKDANNITALGALDTTHDCGAPTLGIVDPTPDWDYEWTYFADFSRYDAPENWEVLAGGTEWVAGQGFVDYASISTDYAKTSVHFPFYTESATIERIRLFYKVGPPFTYDAGDKFRAATDQDDILTYADLQGGDPTSGGSFTVDKVVSIGIASADNKLSLTIEGHLPDPIDESDPRSPFLVGIAIAGSGTNPFEPV